MGRYRLSISQHRTVRRKVGFDLPREVDLSSEGNRFVAMRVIGWEIAPRSERKATLTRLKRREDLPPLLLEAGRW